MGILSLVLGILGVVVFSWLGPVIGMLIVGKNAVSSAMTGTLDVSLTPIWAFGIALGVVVPLVAVVTGILTLRDADRKGLGVAGIVTGGIAAVAGLVITLIVAGMAQAGSEMGKEQLDAAMSQVDPDQINQLLNDPATQDVLKRAMEEANKQQK